MQSSCSAVLPQFSRMDDSGNSDRHFRFRGFVESAGFTDVTVVLTMGGVDGAVTLTSSTTQRKGDPSSDSKSLVLGAWFGEGLGELLAVALCFSVAKSSCRFLSIMFRIS